MLIKNIDEVPSQDVNMEGAKDVKVRVLFGPADNAPTFAMRVFELAPAGHTPFHTHPFEHEVFFHEGQGELFHEGKTYPVGPGHVAYVPAGSLHQFVNTGPGPLVFVCVIPRPER